MNRQELFELEMDMMKSISVEVKTGLRPVSTVDVDRVKPTLSEEVKTIFKISQQLKSLVVEINNYLFYCEYGFEERVEREKFQSESSRTAQINDLDDSVNEILYLIYRLHVIVFERQKK